MRRGRSRTLLLFDNPLAPTLTAPANAAVVADTTPDFSWEAVPDAATYDIEIRATLTSVPTATGIVGTTYTPAADLNNFTVYSWRVRGVNAGGVAGAWSATRTFTVKVYLLKDDFASGVWPSGSGARTADGVGSATVVDTLTRWSMTGGEVVPGGATVASNNPGYNSAQMTRAAGLCFKCRVKRVSAYGASGAKLASPIVVWSGASGGALLANWLGLSFFNTGSFVMLQESNTTPNLLESDASDTYFTFGLILRSTGIFVVLNDKLVFVGSRGNTSPLWAQISSVSSDRHPPAIDFAYTGQLPAPWADESLYSDQINGAMSVGSNYNHEPNCNVGFTLTTVPSAGNIQVSLRQQDINNRWLLDIDSAGALTLQEVVSNTSTVRATITGNQAGDRIKAIAYGTKILIMRERSGGDVTVTYASATNFATATAGSVVSLGTGGEASNLSAWPYDLSGAALTTYQAV